MAIDVGGRGAGETLAPAARELVGRQEASVGAQIGAERMVDRSRHVAGDRVDGFDGAA